MLDNMYSGVWRKESTSGRVVWKRQVEVELDARVFNPRKQRAFQRIGMYHFQSAINKQLWKGILEGS